MKAMQMGEGIPDEGNPIDYATVARGTPIYSSDGVELGRVEVVLDNPEERIFDGIVFKDREGKLRFADAPEVARTAERAVTLAIDAERARELPAPERGNTEFVPDMRTGRLSRLFSRGWKRR